jgi:SMI1 / KNR4 family (SUKH-1)
VALPTTESAVTAAERELGRRLPEALRARLLRNNGGEIVLRVGSGGDEEVWPLHPVWDDTSTETKRRSASHLVREQAEARGWPGFPEGAVAIASYDGDQLVLLPDREEPALWLHETGELLQAEVDWR